jgi:hypothetical protein
MRRGTILALMVLGIFFAATAGTALAGSGGSSDAYLEEERMAAEERPPIGSFEFQEVIETGSLPSERTRSGWEASPREIGVLENGTWAYEEHGMWPPEFAGMTETGSLPTEQFETVEFGGNEYRLNVDLGGGE